tara:strand:- start:36 stop:152 length:117 start_codon:yes stop_codon:yes gene_type:complete
MIEILTIRIIAKAENDFVPHHFTPFSYSFYFFEIFLGD